MGDNSVELEFVSGFWLPTEFLTDDDFVMENKNSVTESLTEFPCHFKPYTDKNAENLWGMSTSPQSTLTNMFSPNGGPRSTTSFGSVDDVISRAASQVAMLKLSGDGDRFGVGHNKDTRFMGPQTCFLQQPKYPSREQTHSGVPYGQRQVYGNRGEMGHQGAWTLQQNPTRIESGRVVGSGVAVKRGTGVFLPRPCRYESNGSSNISESRMRQPGNGSTTLIPDRVSAHNSSNNSIDHISSFSRPQLPSPPMFNRGFIQDYDLLMARRRALILHQQRSVLLAERSSMISRETCLPQEWTY